MIQDLLSQGGWILVAIVAASVAAWSLLALAWMTSRDDDRADRDAVDRASRAAAATPMERRLFRVQVSALVAGRAARTAAQLRPIAVLAAVMPLLGLLGTIVGIMVSFEGLASAPASRIDAMAGGISRALVTTEVGLVATLPVVLAHGVLSSRLRRQQDALALHVRRIEATLVAGEAA
ncbi:MAG: MotA/TolQ/ExbB proton channel family protein [Planctomycetota bacterium]